VKAKKIDAQRESLAKELKACIPKLDAEGLAFLLKQANVHLYNMQVEKLNKAAMVDYVAAGGRSKASAAKSGADAGKTRGVERLTIGGSESGSSYYLYYQNRNIMFSRDEMSRLVKMANAAGTDIEIQERLFNWFERERKDIFGFLPIRDKFDKQMKALVTLLKKSFKAPGK